MLEVDDHDNAQLPVEISLSWHIDDTASSMSFTAVISQTLTISILKGVPLRVFASIFKTGSDSAFNRMK